MGHEHEVDIPGLLADLAADDDPDSWITGVDIVTRSSGTIEGVLESVDNGVAVLTTSAGKRQIPVGEIETSSSRARDRSRSSGLCPLHRYPRSARQRTREGDPAIKRVVLKEMPASRALAELVG